MGMADPFAPRRCVWMVIYAPCIQAAIWRGIQQRSTKETNLYGKKRC